MFDPTKPVRTVSGLEARIIATDVKTDEYYNFPIVALVKNGGITSEIDKTGQYSYENIYSFKSDGTHPYYKDLTLINIPQIVTKWMGVMKGKDRDNEWFHTPMFESKKAVEDYLTTYYSHYENRKVVEIKWQE